MIEYKKMSDFNRLYVSKKKIFTLEDFYEPERKRKREQMFEGMRLIYATDISVTSSC